MSWYNVDFHCPRCGQVHGVIGGLWGGLQIEHGPDREGTIAELYAGWPLPDVLVQLLNDAVWCDGVEDHVIMADPARVVLRPRRPVAMT